MQDDNLLTLEQVCSTQRFKLERLNVSNEDDKYNEEIEKVLVTTQFKGHCNNCVKYGHNKQDCRRNGNNDKSNENTGNKGRFNRTCNYCNKFGHKQAYLYKKHRNGQSIFNRNFNYCNTFGHKREDGRKKERDEQENTTEDK